MSPNLLVVHPTWPQPDQNAADHQLLHLLQLLRQAGHSLTVVGVRGIADPDQRARCQQTLLGLGCELSELLPASSPLVPWTWDIAKSRLRPILARCRFEAAFVSFWTTAAQVVPLFRQTIPDTRVLVASWDVGYVREARGAALGGHLPGLRQIAARRHAELSAYALADAVLAVTDVDQAIIRAGMAAEAEAQRLPPTVLALPPVLTVPMAYPLRASPPPFASRQDVIFVGGFKHQPNIDAVVFLAQSIWPEVAARLPNVRLKIIGADLPPVVRALGSRQIEIVGFVPDLDRVLDAARVAVAPLRFGAGMKGKIAQALAAGLPVVTTSVGAEGMPLVPDRHVLVADAPRDLAAALVRLYIDSGLWTRLAQAGQALMAANYSDLIVAARLSQALFGRLPAAAPSSELPADLRALTALLDGLEWQHEWQTPVSAFHFYDTALGHDPQLFSAALAQAELYLEHGDLAAAQRAWEPAQKLAPDALGVRLTRAELLRRQGRLAQAALEVDQVLAADPYHPTALRLKVECAPATVAPEKLWEQISAARKAYPGDYPLFRTACELAVRARRTDDVFVLLPQAITYCETLGYNADERRFRQLLQDFLDSREPVLTPVSAASPGPTLAANPAAAPVPASVSPLVDIVIPIHGQAGLVRRCIESVLHTAPSARLILVDDASPGGKVKRLLTDLAKRPNVRVVSLKQNLGFIGACKAGAAAATAEFILFLNSDVEAPERGWLDALIPTDPQVAITGARLLFPPATGLPHAGQVQHAGVARNSTGQPYHPFYGGDPANPLVNRAHDVNAVTGACLLIRRQVWEQLAGFDQAFGRGIYEDVNLCWRARAAGYRVRFEPAATLWHHEHASRKDGQSLDDENEVRNRQLLFERWGRLPSDEQLFQEPAVPTAEPGPSRAEHLIAELLQSPNLAQTLQTHLAELDEEIVRLLRARAAQARAQGEADGATALDQLAGYVQQLVDANRQPPPTRAEETLELILGADDIVVALEQHADRLDQELLELIQLNEQSARADGQTELADGLRDLGEYVTGRLNSAP